MKNRKPKNIILHIGFHKTGTTTIQSGIVQNRELLEEMGWVYPKTGLIPQKYRAHYNIAFELYETHRFNEDHGTLDDLALEISQAKQENVLLSSEDFSLANPAGIKRLRSVLGKLGSLKVLVYVRPQTEWLPSMWSQYVKMGLVSGSFDEVYPRIIEEGDFYSRLRPWEKRFGKDAIIVNVVASASKKEDLFQDFLRLCGIPIDASLKNPINTNIMPSIKTINVLRWFNKRLGEADFPQNDYLSYHVANIILEYADNSGWNQGSPNYIDEELYERITNNYTESNQKLAQKYLGRDQLFLGKFVNKPVSKFDLSDLDPSDLLELNAYISEKLLERPYRLPGIGAKLKNLQQENRKLRSRLEA